MDVENVELGNSNEAVEKPAEIIQSKTEIKIFEARIYHIPQIVDLMEEFISIQRDKGNKVYANGDYLRGGIIIEIGAGFYNPMWKVLVAERKGVIVGLLIGIMEHCGPTEKFTNCIRIRADYMKETSLLRPKILKALWSLLKRWGDRNDVGYYYGLIHPGNQASIRAAKEAGFKHHTTQFLRLSQVEEDDGRRRTEESDAD